MLRKIRREGLNELLHTMIRVKDIKNLWTSYTKLFDLKLDKEND